MFSTMTESRPFQSLYSCKDCGDNKLFADNWYISQSLFEYLLGNRSVLGTARKNQINKQELFKNKKSETENWEFCKIMTRKWVNKNDAMIDNYSFVSISRFFISFGSNIQFFSTTKNMREKNLKYKLDVIHAILN